MSAANSQAFRMKKELVSKRRTNYNIAHRTKIKKKTT